MIEGWKEYYRTGPNISNDIDMYKITFPLTTGKTTQKDGPESVPSSSQVGIGDPFDDYEKFTFILSQACPLFLVPLVPVKPRRRTDVNPFVY